MQWTAKPGVLCVLLDFKQIALCDEMDHGADSMVLGAGLVQEFLEGRSIGEMEF